MKDMMGLPGRIATFGVLGDARNGRAILKGPQGAALRVLFSDGEGWDHPGRTTSTGTRSACIFGGTRPRRYRCRPRCWSDKPWCNHEPGALSQRSEILKEGHAQSHS